MTTHAERIAAAAVAVPKLTRLSPKDVADAMPARERGRQAEALRKWAAELESEAKGFAKGKRDSPALADCKHPVGRRLGDYCGACGQTVKAK